VIKLVVGGSMNPADGIVYLNGKGYYWLSSGNTIVAKSTLFSNLRPSVQELALYDPGFGFNVYPVLCY